MPSSALGQTPETPPRNLDKTDVDSLVRTFHALASAYDGPVPEHIDLTSWRASARAAYLDCAARLRETAGAE